MSKEEPGHTFSATLVSPYMDYTMTYVHPNISHTSLASVLLTAVVLAVAASAKEPSIDQSMPHWAAAEVLNTTLSDRTQLNANVVSSDSTIAAHAVWRSFELACRQSQNSKTVKSIAVEKPEYVLGFLESRAKIITPAWWRDALISAHLSDTNDWVFETKKDNAARNHASDLTLPRGATGSIGITGDLEIDLGAQKIRLPAKVVSDGRANSAATGLEVAIAADSTLVAWCGAHGNILLMKVGPEGECWHAMVRGHWSVGSFSGPGERQHVELFANDKSVAVFAASRSVVYFELFDCENGLRQFRFSTDAIPITVADQGEFPGSK
jgi:hypothetical protein